MLPLQLPHRLERRTPKTPSLESTACSHFCRTSRTTTRSSSECSTLWEREETFRRLRELNAGGPRFSFVDGPVTANKSLGVHTAWGRTLKDVFQRYKALRGHHQRYQNGFDCQGLWIEVGVERELGLNSKREIEEYGLAEFARRCREKVVWSSTDADEGLDPARPVDGLGRRLLHVQRHQHRVHLAVPEAHARARTAVRRPSLDRVVPALRDVALAARAVAVGRLPGPLRPVAHRPLPASSTDAGESLVIWTTTPWTLPANVAAAVHPEAEYGLRENGEWVMVARFPDETFTRDRRRAPSSSGSATTGRSTRCLRAPRSSTASSPGTRCRSRRERGSSTSRRAAAPRTSSSRTSTTFRSSRPVDESGRFYDDYGWLHGLSTGDAADQIVGDLAERGLLVHAGLYEHRYPHCWRCDTPLIFRISDDWFLAVDELRQPLLDANATVEWTPAYMGKRMDDWLRNMGDWNISRRRYYGLPLPFYPCACGHADRDRLEGRAGRARDRDARRSSRSCAARGSTRSGSAARRAARRSSGSPRSATSGSTRASSRSRRSAGRAPSTSRRATRPARRRG